MSALKLFDAGYTDLVSVVPPDARISPNSSIDPSQRGKTPGKQGQEGWYGYPFTKEPTPERVEVEAWTKWKANIGLLGNRFPALDIDSDDPALTRFVMALVDRELGVGPVRTSREPRRLLVYRTEEPFGRMAVKVEHNGQKHLIEWLGLGRQYLVHGRHPSGVDYGWAEGHRPLWEVDPGELPMVDHATADAFLDTLMAALLERGVKATRSGDGTLAAEKAPEQDTLRAPDLESLRSVVALVPNPADYGWDEHIRMGYAIKAAAGPDHEPEAFEIWEEWNSRWEAGPNDPDLDAGSWERINPPFRIGWTWLQEQAEDGGDYVAATDEFEADPDATPPDSPPLRLSIPDRIDFTDEWAVSQLLPHLEDKLRYATSSNGKGSWWLWRGHQWVEDPVLDHETIVRRHLSRLAMLLKERGELAPTDAQAKPLFKAAKEYQGARGITSVTKLLRAPLATPRTTFDADPMVLNTPAGPIDLRTGELRDPDPRHMLARSTAVAPRPGATPLWDQFLDDLTGGDEELKRYLQKLLGYALTGDVSEKVLQFIWGANSDTGKSTFIHTTSTLFGSYADSVDAEAFIASKNGRVPDDIARLPGVRLVTATEPSAGQTWNEKAIKAITGGDEISARHLYGSWFTFQPQFKIMIVGNHEPEIGHVDDAMLRRIQIVPFNRKVPRERQIPHLAERMVEEEGPAILAWMLEGCRLWQDEGLAPPEAVVAKTRQYEDDEDILQQWIDEQCDLGPEYEVARKDLYAAWQSWCRSNGYRPGTARSFKRSVDARKDQLAIEETQVGDRRLRGYSGIRVAPRTVLGTEEFDV